MIERPVRHIWHQDLMGSVKANPRAKRPTQQRDVQRLHGTKTETERRTEWDIDGSVGGTRVHTVLDNLKNPPLALKALVHRQPPIYVWLYIFCDDDDVLLADWGMTYVCQFKMSTVAFGIKICAGKVNRCWRKWDVQMSQSRRLILSIWKLN